MIIVERHGFISCKKNLKPVFCLKNLKLKLRKNLETPLKSLEQIAVASSIHMILQLSVKCMKYKGNLQLRMHHSKMAWLKERTAQL